MKPKTITIPGGDRNSTRNKYVRHPTFDAMFSKDPKYKPALKPMLERIRAATTKEELAALEKECAEAKNASDKTRKKWTEALETKR